MDGLKSCPHCGGEAKFVEESGDMKSWPRVAIVCKNEDCYGCMVVTYDEMGTDVKDLKKKMADCWNKRVAN